MIARRITIFAVVLGCLLPLRAGASTRVPTEVRLVAQAATAGPKPNTTGNLPSGTWLLVVIGIGMAIYVSYRLAAPRGAAGPKRREGSISRALSRGAPPNQRDR